MFSYFKQNQTSKTFQFFDQNHSNFATFSEFHFHGLESFIFFLEYYLPIFLGLFCQNTKIWIYLQFWPRSRINSVTFLEIRFYSPESFKFLSRISKRKCQISQNGILHMKFSEFYLCFLNSCPIWHLFSRAPMSNSLWSYNR